MVLEVNHVVVHINIQINVNGRSMLVKKAMKKLMSSTLVNATVNTKIIDINQIAKLTWISKTSSKNMTQIQIQMKLI